MTENYYKKQNGRIDRPFASPFFSRRADFEIEFVARDQGSRKELLSEEQIFGEKDGMRPEAVETYSELGSSPNLSPKYAVN